MTVGATPELSEAVGSAQVMRDSVVPCGTESVMSIGQPVMDGGKLSSC